MPYKISHHPKVYPLGTLSWLSVTILTWMFVVGGFATLNFRGRVSPMGTLFTARHGETFCPSRVSPMKSTAKNESNPCCMITIGAQVAFPPCPVAGAYLIQASFGHARCRVVRARQLPKISTQPLALTKVGATSLTHCECNLYHFGE